MNSSSDTSRKVSKASKASSSILDQLSLHPSCTSVVVPEPGDGGGDSRGTDDSSVTDERRDADDTSSASFCGLSEGTGRASNKGDDCAELDRS